VVPEILLEPVSVYLKAQRSMLMRHMHMGIIMDIMIACCFIIALLLSSLIHRAWC